MPKILQDTAACSTPSARSTGGRANRPSRSWSGPSWCKTPIGRTSSGRSGTRAADLLEPHALAAVPEGGTARLDSVGRLLPRQGEAAAEPASVFSGSFRRLDRGDVRDPVAGAAQAEVLGVHGIGAETADSILLYAGGLPSFVVDAYTYRIFTRHGWIGFDADYAAMQDFFASGLPDDAAMFNEFHALLVRVGKDYCRKTGPKCAVCPLRELLPAGGPREPE